MIITKSIRNDYEKILKQSGESYLFLKFLNNCLKNNSNFENLEDKILAQSNDFFSLFRTTGNKNYFTIGKVFRRVAHKLFRLNNKKFRKNSKFLQLIK